MSGSTATAYRLLRAGVFGLGAIVGAVLGTSALSFLRFTGMPAMAVDPVVRDGSVEGESTGAAEPRRASARLRPTEPRHPFEHPEALPNLVSNYAWPREPEAPTDVDRTRFGEAMARLCGSRTTADIRNEIGPFLLDAAL